MKYLKSAVLAVSLSLVGTAAFAASESCCCKEKAGKMECCDKMKGKEADKPEASKPSAPSDHKDHQH